MLIKPFAFLAIALTAFSTVKAASVGEQICDDTFYMRNVLGNLQIGFLVVQNGTGDTLAPHIIRGISEATQRAHKEAEKLRGFPPQKGDPIAYDCYKRYRITTEDILLSATYKANWFQETKPSMKAAFESWKVAELELDQQMVRLLAYTYGYLMQFDTEYLNRYFNETIRSY
ncbi:hypothetical protein PT974_10765 [Cladobotryum mycophilum]|uniref:Uncharacterized protein n=1 Tax=Cladobotryum mycophilum TaxID=491253 RepID=A0ABR0SAT2_9HYPO